MASGIIPTSSNPEGHWSQVKKTMTTHASMQANERFMKLQALGEQLIPGIPDEITLDHMAPKLHWTDFNILSSVSQVWLHAIRTHRAHDARVRSHSTGTLLLLHFMEEDEWFQIRALFDTREKTFHQLPPFPNLEGVKLPRFCKLVSTEGKVYVLGGVNPKNGHDSTDTVYVLDLAGRRPWKQCASMKNSRIRFGCGVLNGKIYVFGGLSSEHSEPGSDEYHPVAGSEVYDAEKNTWSPIKPMISLQYDQLVETLGAELFVHDGLKYDRDYFDSTKNQMMETDDSSDDDGHIESAESLEIYHPGKAEWRELKPFTHIMQKLYMANGQLHGMRTGDFSSRFFHSYVYDLDTGSWAHQHSFPATESDKDSVALFPDAVLVVDDELFAIVSWLKVGNEDVKERCSLLQIKDLGSKNEQFVMRQQNFPSDFDCAEICSVMKL